LSRDAILTADVPVRTILPPTDIVREVLAVSSYVEGGRADSRCGAHDSHATRLLFCSSAPENKTSKTKGQ
jgi:hypothetical protein